jgi:hypothetical protein
LNLGRRTAFSNTQHTLIHTKTRNKRVRTSRTASEWMERIQRDKLLVFPIVEGRASNVGHRSRKTDAKLARNRRFAPRSHQNSKARRLELVAQRANGWNAFNATNYSCFPLWKDEQAWKDTTQGRRTQSSQGIAGSHHVHIKTRKREGLNSSHSERMDGARSTRRRPHKRQRWLTNVPLITHNCRA